MVQLILINKNMNNCKNTNPKNHEEVDNKVKVGNKNLPLKIEIRISNHDYADMIRIKISSDETVIVEQSLYIADTHISCGIRQMYGINNLKASIFEVSQYNLEIYEHLKKAFKTTLEAILLEATKGYTKGNVTIDGAFYNYCGMIIFSDVIDSPFVDPVDIYFEEPPVVVPELDSIINEICPTSFTTTNPNSDNEICLWVFNP